MAQLEEATKTDETLTDEQIARTVAAFWRKLIEQGVWDAGDKTLNDGVAQINAMFGKREIPPAALDLLQHAMTREILAARKSATYPQGDMMIDYDPPAELRAAEHAVGIKPQWPCKTRIAWYDGFFVASAGYAAPSRYVADDGSLGDLARFADGTARTLAPNEPRE